MNRRAFIGGLALEALAWPGAARAQPARKVYRIGYLTSSGTTSSLQGPKPQSLGIMSVLRGLRELGSIGRSPGGLGLISLDIREFAGKIEEAFKAASHARAGPLLVHPAPLFEQNLKKITELAVRRRLPAIYGLRFYIEAGGLMSYSADIYHIHIARRSSWTRS